MAGSKRVSWPESEWDRVSALTGHVRAADKSRKSI